MSSSSRPVRSCNGAKSLAAPPKPSASSSPTKRKIKEDVGKAPSKRISPRRAGTSHSSEEEITTSLSSMKNEIKLVNPEAPPVFISTWLPKGGVGKTTTSFSLIYTLAERGYRVLAVDCDSQRDLSHLCLKTRYDDATAYDEDYMAYIERPLNDGTIPNRTLHQMLLQMNSAPWEIGDATPEPILENTAKGGSLHLLAGHRDMDMWDSELSANEATFVMFSANKDRVGAPYHAIMKVAKQIHADIVLIDLPPGKGSFTRAMIMSSDYFFVPTKPDYFSFEAVQSLMERLTKNDDHLTGQDARNCCWVEYAQTYLVPQTVNSRYPFPNKIPKFLGFTIMDFAAVKLNNYAMTAGISQVDAAANVKHWMDRVYEEVANGATQLRSASLVSGKQVSMAFAVEDYQQLNIFPFLLGKVHSFGQLQSLSHKFGRPVHTLSNEHFVRDNGYGEFHPCTNADKADHQIRVNAYGIMFDHIAWDWLALIHLDKPGGRILETGNRPTV